MKTDQAICTAVEIVARLASGQHLTAASLPYPIAMGMDGTIGFLYAGGVVDDLTFRQLVQIVKDNNIVIVPELWQ